MWGFFDVYDENPYGVPYSSMNAISQAALNKLERAKEDFAAYMNTISIEECPVTHDLLDYHLVTDCRKKFKQHLQQHHVEVRWRKQQVKGRKSDVWLATITVSPGAKQAWMAAQQSMSAPVGNMVQQPPAGHPTGTSARSRTGDLPHPSAKRAKKA